MACRPAIAWANRCAPVPPWPSGPSVLTGISLAVVAARGEVGGERPQPDLAVRPGTGRGRWVAACLASSIRVAPPAPSTCACIEPEISMTASILDGSLLICTLRIASSTAASAGSGAVTVTTGFIPLAVDDPGPGAPSGARNPGAQQRRRPCVPDQQADQVVRGRDGTRRRSTR